MGEIFSKQASNTDSGLWAFYDISKIILKARKPHNMGGTDILFCISVVFSKLLSKNANEIINKTGYFRVKPYCRSNPKKSF